MWLYSPVCVGPGRNPEDKLSRDAAQVIVEASAIKHQNLVDDICQPLAI